MGSPCSRFFKIILRQSLQDGNLKIPDKFSKKYGGDLPNPMLLKPPDGTEWEIHLIKIEAGILFQKGWREFARYYSLDHGHLVVFEYNGTSQFVVHILDMSGLEIEYPCHDQTSDDSVEILTELPPSQKKRLKSPISSLQLHKKLSGGITRDVESNPNLQTECDQSKGSNFEMPIGASVKQGLDDGRSTESSSRLISSRPGTTKIIEEAKKFTSGNPSFTITIRQCYLERGIQRISFDFAGKYFNKKQQEVMIQYRKKLWPAKILCYQSLSCAFFSGGWSLFVKESNLQAGDVCVLELIDREDSVIKVHILRGHN